MRNRLYWIYLLIIAFALVIFIASSNTGASSDSRYLIIPVFTVGALLATVTMFRRQFAQALRFALIWSVIVIGLFVAYTYRAEFRDIYERVMVEPVPGRAAGRGVRTVEIVRGRAGEFQVGAQVNGVNVTMVLDTGASAVVLTQDAAKAAGLPLEVLVYDVTVETANGRTRAASVTLDRLAVGSIVERSVPALIAQPGQLRTSLLGMSFLNRLESYEVRTDKLLLRGYP